MYDSQYCVCTGNRVYDAGRIAIYSNTLGAAIPSNNVIADNVIYHTAADVALWGDAIRAHGEKSIVANNIIYMDIAIAGSGIYVATGSHDSVVQDNIVENLSQYGINSFQSNGVLISGNSVMNSGEVGILVNDSTRCVVSDNKVMNSAQTGVFDGILLGDSTYCTVHGNQCYDDQGVKTQRYGIAENGTVDYNIITGNNLVGNQTGSLLLLGTHTKAKDNKVDGTSSIVAGAEIHVLPFVFVNHGGGSAGWVTPVINTSPGGIDIDANDEFAYAHTILPEETQQVIRIKIWAYTNILEADKMRLRIVAHGATDNEAWSGNAIDVANHPSESSNFAANDVIYWLIDSGDDAQIGTLTAQDYMELLVVGEAAGGDDCATDILLGGGEIEYL